jgi:hypothetical protein
MFAAAGAGRSHGASIRLRCRAAAMLFIKFDGGFCNRNRFGRQEEFTQVMVFYARKNRK